MLFLLGGDVRIDDEGVLFGSDGSELSMEGANDLSVALVKEDD
jgi:hypothetical protein